MKKVGIITDSGASLEYMHFKHNIKVAGIPINFGEDVLLDGTDTNAYTFYDLIENSEVIPSTSAPFPSEIIRCVKECVEEGCTDVVYIPLSTGLSAYGNNLFAVGDMYAKGVNFHVFPCRTTGVMQAHIAKYAEILASINYEPEQIIEELKKMQDNAFAFFAVDNLKYLVKNGRLGAAAGFIGGLMKIKPIIFLGDDTGLLKVHEKVRTLKKAVRREYELVLEKIQDSKEIILLAQDTARPEEIKKMLEEIKEKISCNIVSVGYAPISPCIGAHTGAGLLGLGAITIDNLLEKEELIKAIKNI